MEVRGVHHFRPALIHPDLFQDCLAVGAVTVAAGVLVELHMSAFGAFADVNAKPAGFTGEDGTGSFLVFIGLKMTGVTVILVRILPDLLDLKVTQGNHLRSGQKGISHFWPGKKPDGYRSYDKLVISSIMTSKYLWKEKNSCLYNYGFLYSFSLHNNRYFLM